MSLNNFKEYVYESIKGEKTVDLLTDIIIKQINISDVFNIIKNSKEYVKSIYFGDNILYNKNLPLNIKRFIKNNNTNVKITTQKISKKTINGEYNTKTNNIIIYLDNIFNNSDKNFSEFKKKIETTIHHELKHLYDGIISKSKKFDDLNTYDDVSIYLNKIYEIDARMSQWLRENKFRLKKTPINILISDFKHDDSFKYYLLTDDNKKRVIKKLTAFLTNYQDPSDFIDKNLITDKIKSIDDKYKLSEYDKYDYAKSYLSVGNNDIDKSQMYIIIASLPNLNISDKYISDILKIADLYNVKVAVSDGKLFKPNRDSFSTYSEYKKHLDNYKIYTEYLDKHPRFLRHKGKYFTFRLGYSCKYIAYPKDRNEHHMSV